MSKYEVWSHHWGHERDSSNGADEGTDKLEVTRSDEKSAKSDADLITAITGRKSWVVTVS